MTKNKHKLMLLQNNDAKNTV